MNAKDMEHLFTRDRLIRTETSTLIGLMLKKEIKYTLPAQQTLELYIQRTESLLNELHQSMSSGFWENIDKSKIHDKDYNPFATGSVLREPIFYGGESAYTFQYSELALSKYQNDNTWLIEKKGFSIQEAHIAICAVLKLQNEKAVSNIKLLAVTQPEDQTFLPSKTFSAQEVADFSHLNLDVVTRILKSFAVSPETRNIDFNSLNDFNIANACPLICTPDDRYHLFNIYSLVESLYESPFYWMRADKSYVNTAMKHRGLFTEQFASKRLSSVFGNSNVFTNIDILESKHKKLGEIDVLVLYGDRALVVQAKSKRLTLESRRGNDLQIKDDFKKSIQDSYDQAYQCSQLLNDGTCTLKDNDGNKLFLPKNIKRIYIICLIADHYPALAFQVRQFIKYQTTSEISSPFVLDVFALDAMTEMLSSPLQLLSYIDRRTGYTAKLLSHHELTILAYHLKKNLWLDDEFDMVFMDDTIAAELDAAMIVRREGLPGNKTPDGILTRFTLTSLGRLAKSIEHSPQSAIIDLGFTLLTLSEDTVLSISNAIDQISTLSRLDGKNHDFTVSFDQWETGLTIHCNNDPDDVASRNLERHSLVRKYTQQAKTWFSVCISPDTQNLRFGLNFDFTWKQDAKMDAVTNGMIKHVGVTSTVRNIPGRSNKTGRNDLCTCGSRKKYKKCCLNLTPTTKIPPIR